MTAIGAPTMAAPTLARGEPPAADDVADAARKLEAFFVRQFLALARPKSTGMLDGGFAGDTFRDMLDTAMADAIADAGGLGLAGTFEAALSGERPESWTPTHDGLSMLDALDRTRAGAPASGAAFVTPAAGRTSSGFGTRVDPMGHASGEFHPGLDIAAVTGTPVVAAAAGQVVHAGPAGTYGNMIAIRHADGTETRYAHLSAVGVAVGDQVAAGAPIGAVGSTGRSTGPHLHFEVRKDGKAVDPRPYLQAPGATVKSAATDRNLASTPSTGGIDGRP